MISRSLSILTKGHVAKNALTYVTSGYILKIETIIPVIYNNGGSEKKKKHKKNKKIIKISVYISGKVYTKTKEVNEDIVITEKNVKIIIKENKAPIIKIKNII